MTIRSAMAVVLALALASCEDNPFGTLEAKYIDTTAPPVPEPPQVPDASHQTPTTPTPEPIIDEDGDGVAASADCDDNDANVWLAQPEVCDGVDNDCDGDVDESEPDVNLCEDDNPYTSDTCDVFADGCVNEATLVHFDCELPDGYSADDGFVCGAAAFFENAEGEYGEQIVQALGDTLVLTLEDVCDVLTDDGRLHTNAYVMDPSDLFAIWVGGEYTWVSVEGQDMDGSPGTVTFFPGGLDFVYDGEDFKEACQL